MINNDELNNNIKDLIEVLTTTEEERGLKTLINDIDKSLSNEDEETSKLLNKLSKRRDRQKTMEKDKKEIDEINYKNSISKWLEEITDKAKLELE